MNGNTQNWPAFEVERRQASALKPFKNNARTHSKEQVAQIAASITEWGWTQPVLVDEKDGVIAGHGRLLAATSLGIAEIPVIVARGWSEAQTRAYVLADNQLALNGGWDENLLRVEIGALKGLDFDLGLTGFGDDFLADLFKTKDGETDPDEIPAPEARAATQASDVWLLGSHRIICGDSTDKATVAALLGKDKPHLMVTDPPYGVEYDPSWRAKAGVNKNQAKMGEVLNDDRADCARPGRCFRATWLTSGMPGSTPGRCKTALRRAASRCARRSSGPRTGFPCPQATITGSMSRADMWSRKGRVHWAGDRSQTRL